MNETINKTLLELKEKCLITVLEEIESQVVSGDFEAAEKLANIFKIINP